MHCQKASKLTLRNQRTPTMASSSCQVTFFFFSFRGCGSGDGTRRAAATARSLAVPELAPTVDNMLNPLLRLPPNIVTPLPRLPSDAKGLALTLPTSVCPVKLPLLLGFPEAAGSCLAAPGARGEQPGTMLDSDAMLRVASTALALMVATWQDFRRAVQGKR